MYPEAFTASLFKWESQPRGAVVQAASRLVEAVGPPLQPPQVLGGGLEELFEAYGIRYYAAAKIAELGFTVSTLVDMRDEEWEEMMNSLSQIFMWDLLVGERYGIRAAVRAQRRRLHHHHDYGRRHLLISSDTNTIDALSGQQGVSEEAVLQEKEAERKKQQRRKGQRKVVDEDDGGERQREHPFIVTEPGEVGRGKKNGLDYLFHLYDQCRDFLIQVQNIAKDRGEKCPTKVTNQVFRYVKKTGARYIDKPKMRHYVHCYALHCLDEGASNALHRDFRKEGKM